MVERRGDPIKWLSRLSPELVRFMAHYVERLKLILMSHLDILSERAGRGGLGTGS